jgi:molecular chaperone Hsp33
MTVLHKFLFDGMGVRGMVVRLDDAWQELLARRAASGEPLGSPVRALLGEMTAAGVLMQANIRFDGALVLQVFGDGPVRLAVAEVGSDLAFRATAKVTAPVADDARLEALVNVHGQGRCAITLDPRSKRPGQQPYQGIVALHGDAREPLQELSQVLEHYMLQSEQLDTRLVLAADETVAAGLLIQRLPVAGEGNLERSGGRSAADEDRIGRSEDFNRIAHLAATLTREELLRLTPDEVLHRLFWDEPLRRLVALAGEEGPRFRCSCSRERVAGMLRSLGRAEIEDIVAEQGRVEIGCDFCGRKYEFDRVDASELFVAPLDQPPGSTARH